MTPSKLTLTLKACARPGIPGRTIEMSTKEILCNDVTLPWDFNPHNTRLWVIGNEFGTMGAVWAQNEQDALDELVDQGMHMGIAIDESDADEETLRAGNASEPLDSDHLWMQEVDLTPEKNIRLLCLFAEARGAQVDSLDRR